MYHQRDVPRSGRLLLERRTLDGALDRAVEHQAHQTDFRHIQLAVDQLDLGGQPERGCLTLLGFEAGEARAPGKKGRKGFVKIAKRLLQ
jgi:hypothetical protein